ncbi:phosphatidate cytidylyltransferase [Aurantiacibacter sp. MUD11]|uniref:phosphatidate cytidylyltransferase n=1 Tax=Aurantiacibacter sp. MUD11 TaxID=3003265 RepID=UPI0022AAFCCD|nr:phosphatidate cytidylyltransferase [Aurantiacibacter sp. MUD11]WAT18652.1 phosphatidate cytidylyltransferase [Aurantiacibacter sp. MUD11]
MLVVAGTAIYLGGWWWNALVAAVALVVLFEWSSLAVRMAESLTGRAVWLLAGLAYVGFGSLTLATLRHEQAPANADSGLSLVLIVVTLVIAVDVGAYFAGRTIGGPKIAPSISPSKTWAGLFGGMAAASIVAFAALYWSAWGALFGAGMTIGAGVVIGAATAVIAQTGDFFESWMKRRAGVKDSGKLIPGHGGLFDRTDGLLAVCVVLGIFTMIQTGSQ